MRGLRLAGVSNPWVAFGRGQSIMAVVPEGQGQGSRGADPSYVSEITGKNEKPHVPRPEGSNGQGLLKQARKLIVLVVGSTVVLVGVAMLVLPGPAVVVIPAGIAILATEFAWARRLLRQVRARIRLAARKARQGREHSKDG